MEGMSPLLIFDLKASEQLAHNAIDRLEAEKQLIAKQKPRRTAFFNHASAQKKAAMQRRIPIGTVKPAYFPHTVNLPVGIGNMRQALLVSRMMRIMAVIFEFLTLAIAFGSLHQPPTVVPVLVLVGLLIAVLIVFVILIRKAR